MAYFANGTCGEVLDMQCIECHIPDDAPCPVLIVQGLYNYDQLKKGNELLQKAMNKLVDEKGNCLMKIEIDKAIGDKYIDGEQADTARIILDSMEVTNG